MEAAVVAVVAEGSRTSHRRYVAEAVEGAVGAAADNTSHLS